MIRRFAYWLLGYHQMDNVMVQEGDWITHRAWKHGPVQVVSMNWALCAIAVRLGKNGGIIVWPMDKRSRVVDKPR